MYETGWTKGSQWEENQAKKTYEMINYNIGIG